MDVIIPTHNPDKKLYKLIKRIYDKTIERVIVIDDKSTKRDWLKKIEKINSVEVYRNKSNVGPGISRNYGFKKSTSDKVIFLDDDILVSKESLKEISKLLEEYDMVIYSFGKHLGEINQNTFVNTGNFFAFQRDKFKELGGFIKFRREDLNLVMKAIKKDFKIMGYNKGVKHLGEHKRDPEGWLANIFFNLIYFDLRCMRFFLFHKPIRIIEELTNWRCPYCKKNEKKY